MNDRHENSTHRQGSQSRSGDSAKRSHQSKGRYSDHIPSSSHRRRRRRNRINSRFVVLLAVLLAMLIGISFGVRSCTKPTIRGRWDLDGTTIYKFDKDGKGALVLMYAEYEFSYAIDGDLLTIDFEDEAALDAKYTFKVENRMLFMTGGPGDARSEYVLNRIF